MSKAEFCHSCGNKLQLSGQAFCQNCGAKQSVEVSNQGSLVLDPALTILELIKESESVAFQANPNDPFYTQAHPFMFLSTTEGEGYETTAAYVEDMWGDDKELNCDNCSIAFSDSVNWIMDDGSNVFGIFCSGCVVNSLIGRLLFTESIAASDYAAWSRLSPRPEAVCWVKYHYEYVSHVPGKLNEREDCWACGYTGTTIDLAQPHWEVTLGFGTATSMQMPVCDGCVTASRVLIPKG